MLESIGLNVIAFEPDAMAIARALINSTDQASQMVIDEGSSNSDMIICSKGSPRLTRSIPIGASAMIRGVGGHLGVDEKQASQFLFKFGLARDKLDGRVYGAIVDVIEGLFIEAEKSNKFFK